MTTKSLLGTTGAAEKLGLSRQGVLKRVKEGRLSPIGTIGKRGTYVFDRAEIEALAFKEAAK